MTPRTLKSDKDVKDKGNVIYYIYLLYGFSTLATYNSVLSTLEYFIEEMPTRNPGFFVNCFN